MDTRRQYLRRRNGARHHADRTARRAHRAESLERARSNGQIPAHRPSAIRPRAGHQHRSAASRTATVCINDASVSRGHARITIEDDAAMLEDLNSKNGTQVMGEPISGPTSLKDGDEIEFGHVKGWFIVEAVRRSADHAPAERYRAARRSPSTKSEAVLLGQLAHRLESRRRQIAQRVVAGAARVRAVPRSLRCVRRAAPRAWRRASTRAAASRRSCQTRRWCRRPRPCRTDRCRTAASRLRSAASSISAPTFAPTPPRAWPDSSSNAATAAVPLRPTLAASPDSSARSSQPICRNRSPIRTPVIETCSGSIARPPPAAHQHPAAGTSSRTSWNIARTP